MDKITVLELADELGIKKITLENKLYSLKRKGQELGTLENGKRYFSSDEQALLKSMFDEKQSTSKVFESTEKARESTDYFLKHIETLEKDLQALKESTELEKSELRQLLAQSNANLNKALENNKQLQLDYEKEKEKPKGFFARLFGK